MFVYSNIFQYKYSFVSYQYHFFDTNIFGYFDTNIFGYSFVSFFYTNIFGYSFVSFFGYKYIRIYVCINILYLSHPDWYAPTCDGCYVSHIYELLQHLKEAQTFPRGKHFPISHFTLNLTHSALMLQLQLREHLPKNKCFLSGITRMGGGEALARIKEKTKYIFILTAEKMYKKYNKCPD